ncbi:hypothetical protein KCP71_08440 [Salmonella enterica subsp. enterica]|nr:hypothetical protein KCP71_08440 [Salmonella enterica subsp. enterica]
MLLRSPYRSVIGEVQWRDTTQTRADYGRGLVRLRARGGQCAAVTLSSLLEGMTQIARQRDAYRAT